MNAHDAPASGGDVLVIDDEQGMRDMLAFTLREQGYQVAAVAHAADGLAHLEREAVDVVLLDVMMPEVDGVTALRQIRHHHPEVEVIMMTGYATMQSAVESLRLGAADYLNKPFELDTLKQVLRRVMDRKRLSSTIALYEAGLAIFGIREPVELQRRIVELAMRSLAADDASLILVDAAGRLRLVYSHALHGSHPPAEPTPIERGVATRIAELRQPALIHGPLDRDPRFADLPGSEDVVSSIVYPLVREGALLGVLNINRGEHREPFGPHDFQRATVLASQIALSIENTRLVAELADRVRDLSLAQGQLVQAEKMSTVGQLAAGVLHEINNPATYVVANLEQLGNHLEVMRQVVSHAAASEARPEDDAWAGVGRLEALVADGQALVVECGEGVERIVEIARDLRSFAHVGERTSRRFPLAEAVQSALRLARNQLRQHAQVSSTLDPLAEVQGNQGQLSQIFLNLLINAVQALEGRPYHQALIDVGLVGRDTWVEAWVRDSGPGVDPAVRPRLFEPFVTSKPVGQGTGLGLSIARDIARRHGGDLILTSPPGEGACFTLRLPQAEAEAGAAEVRPPSAVRTVLSLRPMRLLLVEDDAALAGLLQRTLGARHELVVADGWEAALARLGVDEAPDVVICDLELPGMGITAFHGEVTRRSPRLAERFITIARGLLSPEAQLFTAGRTHRLLEQPFQLKELLVLLAELS